ncbi:Ig-like domain-containing protein [Endozoicomonas numazuensis]|uniref:Ig-like domain-containing protein n=1 Tax=Endozoicomonas numazuensis TaxID=1137799 RepID=UPI0006914A8A|nr:Ig-like domain-containing protein [Endozoicomonas numazuensis]
MLSWRPSFVPFILFLLLQGCGGGGGGSNDAAQDTSPQPQQLTFQQSGSLNLPATQQFTNTASGQGSGAISYSSSDTEIATVDSSGVVSALSAGEAVITATIEADSSFQSATQSYNLTVTRDIQEITFSESGPITATAGDTLENVATGKGSGEISYSSSNTDVATVDANGKVTLLIAGATTITAEIAQSGQYFAADANYQITIERRVQQLSFRQSGTVNEYIDRTLDNRVVKEGSGDESYLSSNTSVATVDRQGQVSLVGLGTTTISVLVEQDAKFQAASANYTLNVALNPQTLGFNQSGTVAAITGEVLTNTASGQGTGTITYRSSDPSKASVDSQTGVISAHKPGSTLITAEIEETSKYEAGTASYTLSVVDSQFTLKAWVGQEDALVEFPEGTEGIEYARSNQEDCDLTNYSACDNGQSDILNGNTILDTAFRRNTLNFAALNHGSYKTQRMLSNIGPAGGFYLNSVVFLDRLWVSGLSTKDGINWKNHLYKRIGSAVKFNNKLWEISNGKIETTSDGMIWVEETPSDNFPDIIYPLVVEFQNKLFMFGDRVGARGPKAARNDIWSSIDGINWFQETESAAFPARVGHRIVQFKDKLWLFAGQNEKGDHLTDIWSSDNGIDWSMEVENAPFGARYGSQVVSFKNQLWLIGGSRAFSSKPMSDVWQSSDGLNWSLATEDAEFPARFDFALSVYQDKLWINSGLSTGYEGFPGSSHFDTWFSSDGINWRQATHRADFSPRTESAAFYFEEKFWLIGGKDGEYKNDIWSSKDGLNWILETDRANFSPRYGHHIQEFNDKLWLIGGKTESLSNLNDIWSSSDGVNWRLETDTPSFANSYRGYFYVFQDQMFLINQGSESKVWRSSDGKSWQSSDLPGFGQRSYAAMTSFNGKLWYVGGFDLTNRITKNDIWSSMDGINWTLEMESAEFPPVNHHKLSVLSNRLWLVGNTNSIWSSEDGLTWTSHTPSGLYVSGRRYHELFSADNFLWLIGGQNGGSGPTSNVFRSEDGIIWRSGYHLGIELTKEN